MFKVLCVCVCGGGGGGGRWIGLDSSKHWTRQKQISGLTPHLIFHRFLPFNCCFKVSFCSLIKGLTPKIRILCFVHINSLLLNLYVFGCCFRMPASSNSFFQVVVCFFPKHYRAFQRAIKLQLNSGKPKEQLKTEQAVQVLLAFPRRPWR